MFSPSRDLNVNFIYYERVILLKVNYLRQRAILVLIKDVFVFKIRDGHRAIQLKQACFVSTFDLFASQVKYTRYVISFRFKVFRFSRK